ncbi:uncharacterized protein [Linepithema humile]|uniref:uncharacterized protein n=1 Tax=Linepithema humile TaxID=83485 RepID=UPI00351F6C30
MQVFSNNDIYLIKHCGECLLFPSWRRVSLDDRKLRNTTIGASLHVFNNRCDADDNGRVPTFACHVSPLSRDSGALLNAHNNINLYNDRPFPEESQIFIMETRERVSSFTEKDEGNKIREEKRCTADCIDRGKVIVVVSTAETKPFSSAEHLKKRKLNDDIVTSSIRSLADKNFKNDDDDDKKNAREKRVPGETKLSRGNREADKIFPQQQQRTRANRSPRCKSAGIPTLLCIDGGRLADAATAGGVKRKIPRPANAFMLFANEWRRKIAAENPRESNKDISVRLGIFWKNMSKDVKEKYFALAREVDKEHKRKYPGMS